MWWVYFDSGAEINLKVLELSGGLRRSVATICSRAGTWVKGEAVDGSTDGLGTSSATAG
jgi:hypothetical protein